MKEKSGLESSFRNTHLNISLNPVRKYPVIAGGRLIIKQTLDQAFKLGADPVILIKPEDNSDENIKNINLSIPYIERGGLRIEILKDLRCYDDSVYQYRWRLFGL